MTEFNWFIQRPIILSGRYIWVRVLDRDRHQSWNVVRVLCAGSILITNHWQRVRAPPVGQCGEVTVDMTGPSLASRPTADCWLLAQISGAGPRHSSLQSYVVLPTTHFPRIAPPATSQHGNTRTREEDKNTGTLSRMEQTVKIQAACYSVIHAQRRLL